MFNCISSVTEGTCRKGYKKEQERESGGLPPGRVGGQWVREVAYEREGLDRPGILLTDGSTLVSHLALFFSARQKPQGLVGSSIRSLLKNRG